MESVKKTEKYEVLKKRSGRFAVKAAGTSKWINGEEKIKILSSEGLIEAPAKKPEPAAEAAEAPAEETSE